MSDFYRLIFVFAFLSFSLNVFCQFSEKEQNDIQKKARKVIKDYEEKINSIGKEIKYVDKTRTNIADFVRLFVKRKSIVFNDLDPSHKLSDTYEAETYASNLALWYPAGITVKIYFENAQVSNILSYGENVYSIDMVVDKTISGMYLSKTLNNNTERLQFRIAFALANGQFVNFKIAGIRKPSQAEQLGKDKDVLDIKSPVLTDDEKHDIESETRTLLNDYANYLSLIGDTAENIEEKVMYKKSFKSLFTSENSLVFNDILPDSKTINVPVNDYINMYSEAYASDGGKVTFQIDSADLGSIIQRNDTLFYRTAEVKKQFTGNYLGKKRVQYTNFISIKIVFEHSNNVFKKFRIDRISQLKKVEKESLVLTDLNKSSSKQQKDINQAKVETSIKPQKIQDKRRNLLFLGYSGGISNFNDANILSDTTKKSIKPKFSYNAYVHYIFKLTPHFGLVTGAGYSLISTEYILSTNGDSITDNHFYKDAFDNNYLKYINVDIDSVVTYTYFNVPVGIYFSFGSLNKTNFFIKPILNIGFLNSAKSNIIRSNVSYSLFYNSAPEDLVTKVKWPIELAKRRGQWTEFGAFSNKKENKEDTIKQDLLNDTHLSLNVSAGILIPLSKSLKLGFSGFAQFSLTDLYNNKFIYRDAFAKTEYENKGPYGYGYSEQNKKDLLKYGHINDPHKAVRPFSFGIDVSLAIAF